MHWIEEISVEIMDCRNNGLSSQHTSIPTEGWTNGLLEAKTQQYSILILPELWDSSWLSNFLNSLPFFLSVSTADCSLLISSALLPVKSLAMAGKKVHKILSPVPFHSSCHSLCLDYPIFKNCNVLSNTELKTQEHSLIFGFPYTHRASEIFTKA